MVSFKMLTLLDFECHHNVSCYIIDGVAKLLKEVWNTYSLIDFLKYEKKALNEKTLPHLLLTLIGNFVYTFY